MHLRLHLLLPGQKIFTFPTQWKCRPSWTLCHGMGTPTWSINHALPCSSTNHSLPLPGITSSCLSTFFASRIQASLPAFERSDTASWARKPRERYACRDGLLLTCTPGRWCSQLHSTPLCWMKLTRYTSNYAKQHGEQDFDNTTYLFMTRKEATAMNEAVVRSVAETGTEVITLPMSECQVANATVRRCWCRLSDLCSGSPRVSWLKSMSSTTQRPSPSTKCE